jgi:septal ring factor EnvC (AmiA/AmiB activator)
MEAVVQNINISVTLLISLTTIIVSLATTFVIAKKQTENNTKQLERIDKKVENHEIAIASRNQEMHGIHHEIDTINTKQAEQDKSFLEIKTMLVRIETDLGYIKINIEDLKEERKSQ